MAFPKPKSGGKYYRCPVCRRNHKRNSTIGNLHKVYIALQYGERPTIKM